MSEYLEVEVKNGPGRMRRILLTGILGLSVFFGYSCKTGGNNNTDTTPYLTVVLEDVFTGNGVSGRVVVNGTEGQSGDRFRIDGKTVNSIEVEVGGYKSSYIIGQVGGQTVFARDKNGTFQTYTLGNDQTMQVKLVPDDFDTVTLAKSIGNFVITGEDTLGDGTVIRYDKKSIDVALWEYEVAAGAAEQNLKDAINIINTGNSIITLNYIGKVGSYLTNGITHEIFKNQNPIHVEATDGNTITRSYIKTMPTAPLRAILEELLQASSGLRADGGTDHCVYVESSGLVNDASRAIYLVNFSPIGFQYSPNNADPAANQPLAIVKSVADQGYEDVMGERSFLNPAGPYRIPEHSGPGRYSNDKVAGGNGRNGQL